MTIDVDREFVDREFGVSPAEADALPAPRFTPEALAELLGQHRPTAQQSEIISSPLEPRLVVAGAGSGKTATMAERVVWLVANGWVRPDEMLGVTFTRKAAGELSARIRAQLAKLARAARKHGFDLADGVLDPEAMDPTVSTYHSFANTIVQDHGLRIGVERDAVLLGAAQSWQLAASVVEGYDGDIWEGFPAKSTLVGAVMMLASECAEHLQDPADVEGWLADEEGRLRALPLAAGGGRGPAAAAAKLLAGLRSRRAVAGLVARFAEAKRRRGALDYGDLVALAARIARDVPEAGRLLRLQYRAVLLDEFQDTSHAQTLLFSQLFGGGHSVMAVGDPNQSIYGFRGASAGQLATFPATFPRVLGSRGRARAAVSHLTTAWRNSVSVLATANIASEPLRRPAPYAQRAVPADVRTLEPSPVATGGRVVLGRFGDEIEEARAIVRELEAFAESRGVLLGGGSDAALTRRAVAAPDRPTMAVLCRKRAQFASVRRELELRGVPYEVVGLGGLLDTPEVIDVVSTLRVIADPGRSDALMRLMTGARWRIGPADLMGLADWSRHLAARRAEAARPADQDLDAPGTADEAVVEGDLAEAASLVESIDRLPHPDWVSGAGRSISPEGLSRLDRLRNELRTLRTLSSDELGTLIAHVERSLLLDIELAARPGASVHQARRNLDAFQEAAASFLAQSTSSELLAFLSWLDAAAQEESGLDMAPSEPVAGAVQLLTVHASKGLEWDAVVVAGLNQGAFPSGGNDRWTSGSAALPWPLRGDRHELPQWDTDQPDQKGWVDAERVFSDDADAHTEREERRLAYVAFTRAKELLVATGSAWSASRAKPMLPSPFLVELREASSEHRFEVAAWVEDGELPSENPLHAEPEAAVWPYDPLEGPLDAATGRRRSLASGRRGPLERAAAAVLAALDELDGGAVTSTAPSMGPADAGPVPTDAGPVPTDAGPVQTDAGPVQTDAGRSDLRAGLAETSPGSTVPPRAHSPRAAAWAREADLLLAERSDAEDGSGVRLPEHVSASTLVALGEDAEAVVRQLRRPVPRRPGVSARRGTAFHAWVEEYYAQSAMLDLEGLDHADEFVDEAYELQSFVDVFRASAWANRSPAFIEVPIETRVGPVVVRGRIDAVFRDADGTWDLVDWKTGRAPSGREARARAVQLAVYRLAWSRLHGVPLSEVTAAFFYLADGRIVRPERLAGEAELERLIADALK